MVSVLMRAVTEMGTEIRRRFAWIYEKLGGFLEISPQSRSFSLSAREVSLMEQSRQMAEQFFGTSAGDTLAALSPQRRMALMEDFVYGLLDLYGMEDCDVILTDSEQIFCKAEAASCMGKCSIKENVIYLNTHFLLQDHEGMLRRCVLNAVHEVRHMMQWQAVKGQIRLDLPARTLECWRRNLTEGYIRASVDFEGYYHQPVEWDARNFACLVAGQL